MQGNGFTEKDWKLFRSKIAGWQENYMERLCKEYTELLNSEANASERFWELEKRIKADKRKVGVQAEMSRLKMIYNIVSLVNEGAICLDDLEGFSEGLKEMIKRISGAYSQD